jgi:hypothetical protein
MIPNFDSGQAFFLSLNPAQRLIFSASYAKEMVVEPALIPAG